jgi:DNA polymerase III subunit alpha
MGIAVLPPDVNESGVFFEPARGAAPDRLAANQRVRPAVAPSVSGWPPSKGWVNRRGNLAGSPAQRRIVPDVVRIVRAGRHPHLNRRVIEALIRSGACDGLGETRATWLSVMDRSLARASSLAADRQRGQGSLFDQLAEGDTTTELPFDRLPELPSGDLLAAEKELLGFYVTGHPLLPYASLVERYGMATTSTLAQLPNRAMTRIGGLIAAVQQGFSKKSGKPYALVTLEDLEGTVQLLCMNENYEQSRPLLEVNRPVLVIGEVNQGEDKPKIFPQEILPLEDAPKRFTRQVHLRFRWSRSRRTTRAGARVGRRVSRSRAAVPLSRHPTGAKVFIEAHERCAVTPRTRTAAGAG